MNDHREKYLKLISDAREYYTSGTPELRNISSGKELFDLKWCPDLTDEINIWNYWQGRGQDKVNIMVVGQDFGNYESGKDYLEFHDMLRNSESESISTSQDYIDLIKRGNSQTDKELIRLTTKCLGQAYSAGVPGNKNLFFTNLCLGYRSGKTISGGDVYSNLKHDSIYLKRLIAIKRPEIVVCLGADTYLAALTGLVEEKYYDERRNYFNKVRSNFWALLDDEDGNTIELTLEGHSYRIFGVAHTGSNGRINRKRLSKKYADSDMTASDLMEMDWGRIKKYLTEDYR